VVRWSAEVDMLPAPAVCPKVRAEKTLTRVAGTACSELHHRQWSCCCPRSLPLRWGDLTAQPHLLPPRHAARFCGLRPTCELLELTRLERGNLLF